VTRAGTIATGVAVIALLSPSGAQALPLYRADGCIDRAVGARFESVSRRGDALDVRVRARADVSKARDIRDALLPKYERLVLRLGKPLPRSDGREKPFEVFVTRDTQFARDNANGLTSPYCPPMQFEALTVDSRYTADELRTVAVHELMHALQHGNAQRRIPANWFNEASAEYVAQTFYPDENEIRAQDAVFLDAPVVPLDYFSYNNSRYDKDGHAYGAQRFLQWLKRSRGWSANHMFTLLRRVFQVQRLSNDATAAFALDAQSFTGKSLFELVGEFWGDRLRVSHGQPMSRGRRITAGVELTQIPLAVRDALAADVVRVRLTPGVREVAVEVTGSTLGPEGRLWVLAGGEPQEWHIGDGESFCVNPGAPTAEREWPGEFAFAYANGGGDANVEVIGSDQPCTSVPTGSTVGCPPPLPYRVAPAGFTNRLTYYNRAQDAMGRWMEWLRKFGAAQGYSTTAYAGSEQELDLLELRQEVRVREAVICTKERLAAIGRVPAAAQAGHHRMIAQLRVAEDEVSRIIQKCRVIVDAGPNPSGQAACEAWAAPEAGGVLRTLGPVNRWNSERIYPITNTALRAEINRCARQGRRLPRGRRPRCETYLPARPHNWAVPPF